MKRRQFIKAAGATVAASAIAAPAIAQANPEIKWRLTSSFPKALDTIYGGGEVFAKQVGEQTDGKFQIQVFAGGEIVPALQALDATEKGTVECCHTVSYYYVGKDPTFGIAASVPFGLNARMQNAWLSGNGGTEAFDEFFKKYGVRALPLGNTGCQMGGWFRKEIKTVADLQGLKFRTAGLNAQLLAKLGVVPQQIAGGEIYQALERGTIDAAEWVGPYDDEKLGFHKVAPFYYYPGFWEGGPTTHAFFNLEKFNALPKHYQAALVNAAAYANTWMQARYDTLNPQALRRLVAQKAQLRPFSNEILDAAYKATTELWNELGGKYPDFKKYITLMQEFRNDQYQWWQVAEFGFDAYMIRARRQAG